MRSEKCEGLETKNKNEKGTTRPVKPQFEPKQVHGYKKEQNKEKRKQRRQTHTANKKVNTLRFQKAEVDKGLRKLKGASKLKHKKNKTGVSSVPSIKDLQF